MKGKLLKHFSFFTSCDFQITKCPNFYIYKPDYADGVKKIFPAVALVQARVIKPGRSITGPFQVE